MQLANVRVSIEYADQNESFAASLPVTGRLLRPLFAANDPRPWWIVALDRSIEYQLKVGEPYQFRLIESGELAILVHLGRWQPKAVERAPPVLPEAWPAHASLPLTYCPLPDIA